MKKSLLGGLIALAFAASANAAVVTVARSFTEASLPATVVFGAGANTSSPAYFEFTSSGNLPVLSLYNGTTPASNLEFTWELYLDTDAATGSANTGALLASATLSPGQSATFTYSAGVHYVMKFTSASTGAASVTMQAVPVPAAAWLFGTALFGAGALRRKQKAELAA